jgi:hypothetical protein
MPLRDSGPCGNRECECWIACVIRPLTTVEHVDISIFLLLDPMVVDIREVRGVHYGKTGNRIYTHKESETLHSQQSYKSESVCV